MGDTGAMADAKVVAETLILVDAEGRPTTDKAAAVGGEIVETLDDGSTRHTLFNIDRSTEY